MEFRVLAFFNSFVAPLDVVGGEQVRPMELLNWLEQRGISAQIWFVRERAHLPAARPPLRLSRLLPRWLGPAREILIIPAVVAATVLEVVRARRAGEHLILWSRVPGGVSWKMGIPIVGDPSIAVFPLARLLGFSIWATNHDISPDHEYDKILQRRRNGTIELRSDKFARRSARVQAWIQRAALPHSTVVTAVSAGTKRELERRYRLRPETTGIVRAGVSPLAFANRRPWQPPSSSWRIGYLGGAQDADTDLLLATLRGVAGCESRATVVLMGRGFDTFEKRLLPAGLEVEIYPSVKYLDLAAVSERIDIWLVPLGTDGYHAWAWPLKIPMYLASGRPVVISKHPEIEPAGVGPYVFAVEPSPVDGLAAGIRAVMAHPEAAVARATAAREYALEHLSWDRQFSHGLELLTRAIASR